MKKKSKSIRKYRKLKRVARRKKRHQEMRKSFLEKFVFLGILILATKLSFNAGSQKSDTFLTQQRLG